MQYALCPFCLSTLQFTSEQLAIKDGLIRCGHCNDIFNANENKYTPPEKTASSNPIIEPLSQSLNKQTPPEVTLDEEQLPPVSSLWETEQKTPKKTLPYGLISSLLVIILAIQFTLNQQEFFTQNTSLQPAFKRLNSAFGMQIPHYKNLSDFHIIERRLTQHPQLDDLLTLQLTIKNTASAEQAYPSIRVQLTSSSGEKVAQGMFTKGDYLDSNELNDFFAPNALRQIELTFKRPSKTPAGFEISFHY